MILPMTATVESKVVHQGPLFSVEALSWRDPQGREIRRDVVRHPGAVLIVPVLDDSNVVFIRNRRIAVGDWLLEFPAGTLELGEDPALAAARELEEETGYRAGTIEKLGEFYTSPGFADELMRVFLARDLQHVGQRLEPHESITVESLTVAEALQLASNSQFRDGKSLAALLMWLAQSGRVS